MRQAQDREYGHIEEYKLWLKSDKLERKAVDLSVLSYVQRYGIREKCRGDMARVRAALCKLSQSLDDDDFQTELDPLTAQFTEQHPHIEKPPRRQGLQVTSWTPLSPQLRDALIRDGFQCVSDADAVPQIHLGVGVLEAYKILVTHPDVVSTSKAAEGIVRGRPITQELERLGAASGHRDSPVAMTGSEGSGPTPAREKAAVPSGLVTNAAVPAPRVRMPAERSPDPACVRAPDVPLHHLMATMAGGELLAAIVAREGEVDFAGICRHLRGSYALSRIAAGTQEKISKQLKALSTGEDSRLSLGDLGRYRRRSPSADPALLAQPADHDDGPAPEATAGAGARPIVLRGPKPSTETGIDGVSIDLSVSDELSANVGSGRAGNGLAPPPASGPENAALPL